MSKKGIYFKNWLLWLNKPDIDDKIVLDYYRTHYPKIFIQLRCLFVFQIVVAVLQIFLQSHSEHNKYQITQAFLIMFCGVFELITLKVINISKINKNYVILLESVLSIVTLGILCMFIEFFYEAFEYYLLMGLILILHTYFVASSIFHLEAKSLIILLGFIFQIVRTKINLTVPSIGILATACLIILVVLYFDCKFTKIAMVKQYLQHQNS